MRTAENKCDVEVLVAYDNDDESTKVVVDQLVKDFKQISLKMVEYERVLNAHSYYNDLYKISTGQTLITINDDSEFLTDAWDVIANAKIEEFLEQHPDGLYYGYVDDLLASRRHGQYCCFPFISRKAVDMMGFLQSEEFIFGGADIYLGNLMHNIGRVIDMKDIQIDHISFHNYPNMEKDELYEDNLIRIKECQKRHIRATTDIEYDRQKMLSYIGGGRR